MKQDITKSIEACAAHYGEQAQAMKTYLLNGQAKASSLNNRGPISFDNNGTLAKHIVEAYNEYGFYIFENVLNENELNEVKADLAQMRSTFSAAPYGKTTADGKPALGADHKAPSLIWSKSLGDPLGGTDIANGRHQVKLFEPTAAKDTPEYSPFVLLGSLQFSEACLRIYGHPQLLRVAEAVNGKDFAPFHECLFIKDPGVGAAVSWHQDGDTHWNSQHFDDGIHGFNFMAQVYGSTAVNGVWVLPGSHKTGKIDIKALIEQSGSERIEGLVPLICGPGDVVICNRQLLHGSFANTGFEPRVTVNFGFHRRSSVLGIMGAGMHSEAQEYTEEIIEQRSKVIGYAIDARKQKYPDETPYQYQPFIDKGLQYRWDQQAQKDIKDYNLHDLSI
ncbi:phytanoyl-CoA dioxygenase family protein [Shewanella sp. Arc9-LZ]|jgi:ectoine hydroxylase-related dioxygenase (phytanoyl-CoA dioxygenase family)|uniref:phytanoyl-CoA dioxygenase family protein n=1 Tax=Shewanella sp. Arc9-LZ TaxID=2698686 RepID=UPI00137BB40F|nr:phytanoyl-CoA dioxygenase family protein [Shewanella sp. Arc9-LZ]QHS14327.1 phytanoyl-CoA dioxygenase family protein [Shewanella sp. Arc9-LZ]